MSGATLNLNSNLISKNLVCDDVYLGLNRTIYGNTSLNLNCPVINIGSAGQQVNFSGDLASVKVTNLEVNDQLITINKNGNDASSKNAGFQIAATNSDGEGYFKSDSNGEKYLLKAPLNQYVLSTPVLTSDCNVLTSNDDVLTSNSNISITKITEFGNIANSKFLQKDSNGDLVGVDSPSVNNIVDAQIDANAAISRSKIAADTSNEGYFLYNDRNDGTLKPTSVVQFNTMNRLILSPPHSVVITQRLNFGCEGIEQDIIQCNTTNDTATNLYTGNLTANYVYLLQYEVCAKNNSDNKSAFLSGKIKAHQGALNTHPSFSSIIEYLSIPDSGMEDVFINIVSNNNTEFSLMVTGIASKNIAYRGFLKKIAVSTV